MTKSVFSRGLVDILIRLDMRLAMPFCCDTAGLGLTYNFFTNNGLQLSGSRGTLLQNVSILRLELALFT